MKRQDIYANRLFRNKELEKLLSDTGVSAYNKHSWASKILLALHLPLLLILVDLTVRIH